MNRITCILGFHSLCGLTVLKDNGEMEVTFGNGRKETWKLPEVKLQVCHYCKGIFLNPNS